MPALACVPDPAPAPAPAAAPGGQLVDAYDAWLSATGRGSASYIAAAAAFVRRWPVAQAWADEPLPRRLAEHSGTRPFLTFLMLHGWLRPGYDWLATRKIGGLVELAGHSPLAGDVDRFLAGADELGFSASTRAHAAGRIAVRLLIQSGRPLQQLRAADLAGLEEALRARAAAAGRDWRNDRGLLHTAGAVLFHLGVLADPPRNRRRRVGEPHAGHLHGVTEPIAALLTVYLQRLVGTHAPSTINGTAIRLAHFGRHLATAEPDLASLAGLDRRRHIESYLDANATARRPDGEPISIAERRSRIITLGRFLADITEWGWAEAPTRRLVFSRDAPRLPRPLPRYLPPDADRRLVAALQTSPRTRLFADALLLARATGLRVGELVDLELDCVHELDGHGAWLKVPLGKLATERMVPLDDDVLQIVDRLAAARSPGLPLPHPRTGKPIEFLLTHHGKRVSTAALRDELARAATDAGLERVTPHQLRHTYATGLVNAGVSLQALMALLGHTSAAMSLRYGRLFDATVRADYERALTLAKQRLGPAVPERTASPAPTGDWRELPLIKSRLAGGYCLRTAAQGACPYTNICEHCPNLRTDAGFLGVLSAQRTDADALATDAQARGWDAEATRHRQLVARLDGLIASTHAS